VLRRSKHPLLTGYIRREPHLKINGSISKYKREAPEWGGPSDETGKTEVLCHSRCGAIKIPPCSKALSAEHRPKFCSTGIGDVSIIKVKNS
jgi:hypothetical protein